MATYVPNATQTTEPVESRAVESAALEFRTLKTRINALEVAVAVEDVKDLRAPEAIIAEIPALADRAGKVLGFDAGGDPVAIEIAGTTDPSLRSDLAASSGASLVGFQQAGGVARTVESKLRERVSVKDFGAVGDGVVDDTVAVTNAAAYAASKNLSIVLDGAEYIVSTLILSVNTTIKGSGTIRKKPGTLGHLIDSTAALKIDGITLDQNAVNCPNPDATYASDCTIRHTGEEIELIGVYAKPSVSTNIFTSATKKAIFEDNHIDGGWSCLLADVSVGCQVRVGYGLYENATVYDNVKILRTQDFMVRGVTSRNPARSCIVAETAAKNGSISGNVCYGAKIDASNQGGWGIVLSVSVSHVTVSGNHCYGNARGGVDSDVSFGGADSIDSYIVIIGNTIENDDPENGTRTGIYTNKSGKTIITGNAIKNFKQGVSVNISNNVLISSNIIENCGTGYFIQTTSSNNISINGNMLKNCVASGTAAVQVNVGDQVEIHSNTLDMGECATRGAVRLLGACSNFAIRGNAIRKSVAGSGYVFQLGTEAKNGRISNNEVRSGVAGWQWYLAATDTAVTNVITELNTIDSVAIDFTRYILNGAGVIADSDSVLGVKNLFSAAPTGWTFRKGYIAINNNIPQFWNGTSWVTI